MKRIRSFIHHFFIPHKKNKYRAKALHLDALGVYFVLVVCITLILNQLQRSDGSILGYATDITIQKVYELVNNEREKYGLDPLEYNEQLSEAAHMKATDMFTRNYWNHYGPDGTTPWEFILGAGYDYEYAGENLAKNFMFSDGVVKAWMNSPTHKENIVRAEYTEVGYAVANGILNGEETTLVVQMFGTPISTNGNGVFAEGTDRFIDQVEAEEVQQDVPTTGEVEQIVEQESGEPVLAEINAVHMRDTSSNGTFFGIAYNVKVAILVFLFCIIALDFYIGIKYHIIRLSGKNIIHLAFIGFIIAGVYLLAKGAII